MDKTVISLLTLITFLPYYCIITGTWRLFHLTTTNLPILFFYIIYSLILVAILYLIHRKNILASFGLDKNIIRAIVFRISTIITDCTDYDDNSIRKMLSLYKLEIIL
jgi:hypothetical protein